MVMRPQLDFTELDNRAPIFATKLKALVDQCSDLTVMEEHMWTVATEVFGLLQPSMGGKPFLNQATLGMKKVIRTLQQLLRHCNRSPDRSPSAALWDRLKARASLTGCTAECKAFFTLASEGVEQQDLWPAMPNKEVRAQVYKSIANIRLRIRTETRNMQQAQLTKNMDFKRTHLETGKRGVQKAMGKAAAGVRMTILRTNHPDTVIVPLQGVGRKQIKSLCKTADAICRFARVSEGQVKCVASRLHCVFDILCMLEANGITASVSCSQPEVDDEDDLLSALEHCMGSEGKARGMVCPTCKSPGLTCLSRVVKGQREIGWFCRHCHKCCEYEANPALYYKVPWDPECVDDHRQIPDHPIYQLCEQLEWGDFEHLLLMLPNRKAAGENRVPAELWKAAPDFAKKMLFEAINQVLAGGAIPPHWLGGVVQFLFKKPPAYEIANWRPVCLINVS